MFTKEEIIFIGNVIQQLTFKPGNSDQLLMAEGIINKINGNLSEQKEVKSELV